MRKKPTKGTLGWAWLLLGASLLSLPTTGAGQAAPPAGTPKASELRIGIAPVYPPIAMKEDGQLKGVEVDFANQLSKDLKVKVTFVELPWDGLIPALNDNRIDVIMSGMSITPKRSEEVAFTHPYLRVGQMVLIRRADYSKFRAGATMNAPTARVGFQTGTTGEAYARANLTHAQLQAFPTPEAGIAALRAGQIDFFIHDAPTVWRVSGGFERKDPELMGRYRLLTKEELAWAVRKGDTSLLDRLNGILQTWKKNGEIEHVLDRWIPVRKVTIDKPAH